jgi:hypothetical protein
MCITVKETIGYFSVWGRKALLVVPGRGSTYVTSAVYKKKHGYMQEDKTLFSDTMAVRDYAS